MWCWHLKPLLLRCATLLLYWVIFHWYPSQRAANIYPTKNHLMLYIILISTLKVISHECKGHHWCPWLARLYERHRPNVPQRIKHQMPQPPPTTNKCTPSIGLNLRDIKCNSWRLISRVRLKKLSTISAIHDFYHIFYRGTANICVS